MERYFLLIAFILSLISFYIRYNYAPFVDIFGLYQGDLWYFYTYYGEYIKHNLIYPIEYPLGYVLIHKLTYFLSSTFFHSFTYQNFVIISGLIMIPTILGTVYYTHKLLCYFFPKNNINILLLCLSPTFFIASTTNYDIFPVFFTLLSLYLLLTNKFSYASLFLGIGALIKLYPAFLIPTFLIYIYYKTSSIKEVATSLTTFSVVLFMTNLPFAAIDFNNWLFPYKWQASSPLANDPNTLFYYLNILSPILATLLLPTLIIISWVITFLISKRGALNEKSFLLCCYLTVFSCVLGNHVSSPQYVLWYLPFVSITSLPHLLAWVPFDIINFTELFNHFKLVNEWKGALTLISSFTILYSITLYLILLKNLFKFLHVKKSNNTP